VLVHFAPVGFHRLPVHSAQLLAERFHVSFDGLVDDPLVLRLELLTVDHLLSPFRSRA
jgi:hypothetical protein